MYAVGHLAWGFLLGLAIWGLKVVPHFAALAQHSLFDALDVMGVQLLWPLTTTRYSLPLARTRGLVLLAAEWMSFLLSLTLMLKTGEARKLLKPHYSNLLAIMPLGALVFNVFIWHLPRELNHPNRHIPGNPFAAAFRGHPSCHALQLGESGRSYLLVLFFLADESSSTIVHAVIE